MRNYHRINPLFRFAVNMPVNRVFNLFIFLLLFSEFLLAQSVGRFGFSFRLFFGVRDAVLCVLRIQLNRPSGVLRSHWCYCVSLFRIRWIRSVYRNTNPFGSLLLLRVYTNRAAAAAVFVRISFCHAPTHSFKLANKQKSERNDTDTNTHAIAQRHTHIRRRLPYANSIQLNRSTVELLRRIQDEMCLFEWIVACFFDEWYWNDYFDCFQWIHLNFW